jgi:hypothetical protein
MQKFILGKGEAGGKNGAIPKSLQGGTTAENENIPLFWLRYRPVDHH